jgi:hypothetical protein
VAGDPGGPTKYGIDQKDHPGGGHQKSHTCRFLDAMDGGTRSPKLILHMSLGGRFTVDQPQEVWSADTPSHSPEPPGGYSDAPVMPGVINPGATGIPPSTSAKFQDPAVYQVGVVD